MTPGARGRFQRKTTQCRSPHDVHVEEIIQLQQQMQKPTKDIGSHSGPDLSTLHPVRHAHRVSQDGATPEGQLSLENGSIFVSAAFVSIEGVCIHFLVYDTNKQKHKILRNKLITRCRRPFWKKAFLKFLRGFQRGPILGEVSEKLVCFESSGSFSFHFSLNTSSSDHPSENSISVQTVRVAVVCPRPLVLPCHSRDQQLLHGLASC